MSRVVGGSNVSAVVAGTRGPPAVGSTMFIRPESLLVEENNFIPKVEVTIPARKTNVTVLKLLSPQH